jgi:hypothetical protein
MGLGNRGEKRLNAESGALKQSQTIGVKAMALRVERKLGGGGDQADS